ncbi:uncharacterized protein [Apostichopus japonicus]|uniref:uncharacterized protein n=1 Tax=Stichopus japonicus TaxID=307972 RepID=UPI003AB8A9EF
MDDDDTGYASGSTTRSQQDSQSEDVLPMALWPFSGDDYDHGFNMKARAVPSCAIRTSSDSEDSTDSAINLNDNQNAFAEVNNISQIQYTHNKTLSFHQKQDGSGYYNKTHSSLRELRLDRSIEDKFMGFTASTGDLSDTCEQISTNLATSNGKGSHREDCLRPTEYHGDSSKSFSHDLRASSSNKVQQSMCPMGQQSADNQNSSEDSPDFLRSSSPGPSQFKRKENIDDDRPLKRVKGDHGTENEKEVAEKEDIPSIDVAGHGNLVLAGNSNMTLNFFSNSSKHENDTTKHCWDWSRTSEKEAQVEDVTDVFRKFADGLSQHVDHRKVARFLEFADMVSLEDDLKKLRTMKTSESDRIFFVLLRWWKEGNFGNDREAIKRELGFLLEDLRLQRMKRNLKQFFC